MRQAAAATFSEQVMGSTSSSQADKPLTHTIQELRRSRASILSYLLKLNKCIDAQHRDLVQAVARRFSETLIDYISYGHFRLFTSCHPACHHVPVIENTTQSVLRFNDQYAHSAAIDLNRIKQDLEGLALTLEVHFEIEDEMISQN